MPDIVGKHAKHTRRPQLPSQFGAGEEADRKREEPEPGDGQQRSSQGIMHASKRPDEAVGRRA
jgi:hypothetical protein